MADFKETAFEYIAGEKFGGFSSSESKWINKIKEYAKEFPDDVKIIYENSDGSIFAHIPTSWFKIKPKSKRQITDEQREELRERIKKMHEARKNSD